MRSGKAGSVNVVRILLLIIVAVIFLTGIVWWVTFFGNAVMNTLRKR